MIAGAAFLLAWSGNNLAKAEDTTAAAARKIFADHQDSVVWVSVVGKISISSAGGGNTQNREEKMEALATVITSDGLLVSADPFFTSQRVKFATLAAHHALPAAYPLQEFAEAGGLMSYGPSILDAYRQVGAYAGRMLGGARPEDMPVVLPTKFDFILNLQTAKALGLTIPPQVLSLATKVIE